MSALIERGGARWLIAPLLVLGAALAYAADVSPSVKPTAVGGAAAVGGLTGEGVYSHICQGCHMAQGQGAEGAGHYPKLDGDPALASWQYVAMTVLGGRNDMPAFGLPVNEPADAFGAAYLSDQEIADVVNYVRGRFVHKSKEKVTAAQVAGLPHPGAAPR